MIFFLFLSFSFFPLFSAHFFYSPEKSVCYEDERKNILFITGKSAGNKPYISFFSPIGKKQFSNSFFSFISHCRLKRISEVTIEGNVFLKNVVLFHLAKTCFDHYGVSIKKDEQSKHFFLSIDQEKPYSFSDKGIILNQFETPFYVIKKNKFDYNADVFYQAVFNQGELLFYFDKSLYAWRIFADYDIHNDKIYGLLSFFKILYERSDLYDYDISRFVLCGKKVAHTLDIVDLEKCSLAKQKNQEKQKEFISRFLYFYAGIKPKL
jgi:hypothetical protein